MNKYRLFVRFLIAFITISMIMTPFSYAADDNNDKKVVKKDGKTYVDKVNPKDRTDAAERLQKANVTIASPATLGIDTSTGYQIPDYFGAANWAYSPQLTKFIDKLPALGPANSNALGQYIPVAKPETKTYNGVQSDYYEIAVIEYYEKMHSDLPKTLNRGYVQLSTTAIPGKHIPLTYKDGVTPILKGDGTRAYAVDNPHYLGPAIVSESNRPVRIKFYNLLPTGADGDLFIPVDTTVMGAGSGTMDMGGTTMSAEFTQNRANIHLHGNNTVWISDGTPHQWITPAKENTMYPQGVSVVGVPDMEDVSSATDGTTTLYYTNAQSARLMFYHDHSYGITRLNVYSGEAAPYVIQDQVEKDLIAGTNISGVNPDLKKILPDIGIPLVIQDRTFVDAATISVTDPTWAWGTKPATPATFDSAGNKLTDFVPGTPITGDLWYPHVYSPAQNPYASDGINPFGRWMYGPWFWPPTSDIAYGPIDNPYYNADTAGWEPPLIPGTPNPSAPGESFMDTPIVNGTAYPYIEVDPKAYRFRILNAANDRFFNLQMYVADDTYLPGQAGYLTEVKMVPATPDTPLPSHREQIIPDPLTKGPDWIQIGTEGGFLPSPVVMPSQPITWNLGLTAFNAGNVDQHSLLLGTAERADVIVDFSSYAGKTLILYNDAPAPFPASDPRYDYYTNNPDQKGEGGAPSTQPGKGPNIRTIMQIRVSNATPVPYDLAELETVFAKAPATATKPAYPGVFATSQKPIIIPQAAYNTAYGVTNLPVAPADAFVQLDEFEKTFRPIDGTGILQPNEVTLPLEPKAMQDEMGEVYDDYGRMSGMLGLTSPVASAKNAPFIPYGYASPPVDIIEGTAADLDTTKIGTANDGTQIWRINHNGVDTHTIHTHLFDAQLINRVAWDGAMIAPDQNELGWKETFRVNPLEQTFIAMRPKIPDASIVPFNIPNSVRLIDPTMPEGAPLMTTLGWFDPQGNPIAQILNHYVNYGWEYVYHCHILSHEEMDMMHAMSFAIPPKSPTGLAVVLTGTGKNIKAALSWSFISKDATSFKVQRAATSGGPWATIATVTANTLKYSDPIGNTKNMYFYRVIASNTVGDSKTPGFPTITVDSGASNIVSVGTAQATKPVAPSDLTAALQPGPQVLLSWLDNADTETGFVIQRSSDKGATYSTIVTVAARNGTGRVSYTDTTVSANASYMYRVAAVNSAGVSAYSNTASAILPSPPAAPSNVAATAEKSGNRNAKVTLIWRDIATNETGYVIERATNDTFTANLITFTVATNTTMYQTGNLTRNTPYYFRIRAINGVGQSAWVSAVPFPIQTP